MTSLKLGKPVSFIYGEQGKYSLAEVMQPAPEPVPPALPVHFVNVTLAADLPAIRAPRRRGEAAARETRRRARRSASFHAEDQRD